MPPNITKTKKVTSDPWQSTNRMSGPVAKKVTSMPWQSTNKMSGPAGPPVHRPGPAPVTFKAPTPVSYPGYVAPAARKRRSATSGGMTNVKDLRLIKAMTPR